jgi:hypothetical protein
LVELVAQAMAEAAEVKLRKAEGDYSPDEGVARYPAFEVSAPLKNSVAPVRTFEGGVTEQARLVSLGVDAVPLRPDTVAVAP